MALGKFLRKRWVLYILLCVPIGLVFVPILQGDTEYFADPIKFLLEYIGLSATVMYVIVMSITPLRMLFPKSVIVKAFVYHRRQIGVSVFIYALLHVVIYYFYAGSWKVFFEDWGKLFILSGVIGVVLLGILAFTSNNWAVKRMGIKSWRRLHLLAHATMIFLIYHQATQEKSGYRETLTYFAPLLILQGYRLIAKGLKKKGVSS